MKSTNYLTLALLALLLITGCSAGGSGDSASQTLVDAGSLSLSLSTPSIVAGSLVSHGGQTTVRAYLSYTRTDESGNVTRLPVDDGTVVNFYVIDVSGTGKLDAVNDSGRIETTKTTVGGYASSTYNADNSGGIVKIYAETDAFLSGGNSEYAEATISFEVATGAPVSIAVESVTPSTIGVLGSGKPGAAYTSSLVFFLTDSAGNPVPDFNLVTFNLTTSLGGGEKLTETEGETQRGKVFVSLVSGTVSGTVGVNATYFDQNAGSNISTEAKVTIVSGLPSAEQLGMAVELFNIAGGRTFGLQDEITAYLGDRYGNVIPDGTPVSFMTEGGTIGTSAGFDSTTEFGVARATLQTSPPTVPNLAGVTGSTPGNVGLCRVVAYTLGNEGFNDINGNNTFDQGIDVLTMDMSEPYIDANDNGSYDSGEKYIDSDGSGSFTPADGLYQANTFIWDSVNVLFSGPQTTLNLQPTGFTIVPGGSQTFAYRLADIYGNSLVGGTTVKVTATGATLSGNVDFTLGDSVGVGRDYFFRVGIPADFSASSLEVKLEVTPPTGGDAGANSDVVVSQSAFGTLL